MKTLTHVPSSVYRLQLNENFPLKKVISLLPYLQDLGVEGLYLSPIFESQSPHGYDIMNSNRLNPLIGTPEEFDTLCQHMKQAGFKLIIDVVPNHMGIKNNPWWLDVMEYGPESTFASFFDIDWNPAKEELKNKVLLPLLKTPYGESLENQEIQLGWDNGFWIYCNDYRLPLCFESYSSIIEHHDKDKEAFVDHTQKDLDFQNQIANSIVHFNGKKGEKNSFDPLHKLLEQQHYRLAYWEVAGKELNYRRFFNITELVGIHIENEKVLQKHHEWVFQLLKDHVVQGLRIDHPDGLYDPTEYLERIHAKDPPLIEVEKILDFSETIPKTWAVDGTVGYEFINILNGLFIDQTQKKAFKQVYEKFIHSKEDFENLLYERKKWVLKVHLASEANSLGWKLDQISESNRYYRDFTQSDLTQALYEVIACFPVYRTYIRPNEEISNRDRDYIIEALNLAKNKLPDIDPLIFTYIQDVLLMRLKYKPEKENDLWDFILRFQQVTSPVMAKGLEDSCYYIFNRFISSNEVGGKPTNFGFSKAQFHQYNIEKLATFPLGFLPASTHDTKRSSDVRLRLDVLSENPGIWRDQVFEWKKQNLHFKKEIDGSFFPDSNTEYYLYQTLLGVWPSEIDESGKASLLKRLETTVLKSIREAGVYTSWRFPKPDYEKAVLEFLFSLLKESPENPFYPSFLAFLGKIEKFGRFNSLAALVLRMGSCGIIDIYQGDETWNFSLMDPDNRRVPDFDDLQESLAKLSASDFSSDMKTLKLHLTATCLRFRRIHKDLFLKGSYEPLKVLQGKKEHCIGYIRRFENEFALIAGGRFFSLVSENEPLPIGQSAWEDTQLILPKNGEHKELRDLFTNKSFKIQKQGKNSFLLVSDLFNKFPFTILTNCT